MTRRSICPVVMPRRLAAASSCMACQSGNNNASSTTSWSERVALFETASTSGCTASPALESVDGGVRPTGITGLRSSIPFGPATVRNTKHRPEHARNTPGNIQRGHRNPSTTPRQDNTVTHLPFLSLLSPLFVLWSFSAHFTDCDSNFRSGSGASDACCCVFENSVWSGAVAWASSEGILEFHASTVPLAVGDFQISIKGSPTNSLVQFDSRV